jgi:hypothetical protein
MKTASKHRTLGRKLLFGLAMVGLTGLTGCQAEVGGQLLPSPYYLQDDVQYFPHGHEFKLYREAAKQKEAAQEQAMLR